MYDARHSESLVRTVEEIYTELEVAILARGDHRYPASDPRHEAVDDDVLVENGARPRGHACTACGATTLKDSHI